MTEKNLGLFGIVTNYPSENSFRKELLFYNNPSIMKEEDNKID